MFLVFIKISTIPKNVLKGVKMFEKLLKEIKDTLDNTKYVVVVPVPSKKLWEDLCDVLQSTRFASFNSGWARVKNEYWEEYKEETVMCFRVSNSVVLSYSCRSYQPLRDYKKYKFLDIPLNTPKCLRRL